VISVRPDGSSPFLILVDHAGRAIPQTLGDLGLDEADRRRHIAWDIGALEVARRLSDRLDAEVIAQAYSRLVIDCNRDPAWASSIAAQSEETPIPANQALSEADRSARRRFIFEPYHAFIQAALERRAAEGRRVVVIALHSMTNVYLGVSRPMPGAVLFGPSPEFARLVLSELRGAVGAEIAENAPYALSLTSDYTVPKHALARGLPYAEIEMRQDLVAEEGGCALWAERLATALTRADSAFRGSALASPLEIQS
jgi:predicted N-formylglutamate amidohydrolase